MVVEDFAAVSTTSGIVNVTRSVLIVLDALVVSYYLQLAFCYNLALSVTAVSFGTDFHGCYYRELLLSRIFVTSGHGDTVVAAASTREDRV